MIAGDFNVEPTKIPCLLKGISAGLWVDLQGAWARAASVEPDVTCKRDGACIGKTRMYSGLSLAAAALGGCWVDCCCWIQPHLSVIASFVAGRWSEVTQPVWFSPLWPASWVSAVDKSRKSKSAEVREVWEVYDHGLQFVQIALEMLWLVVMAIWLGRIGLLPRSKPSPMPLGWQGPDSSTGSCSWKGEGSISGLQHWVQKSPQVSSGLG